MVLQKISGHKITLLDPALGVRVMSRTEVSQHFTGIALELTPQADFKTMPAPKAFPLSMLTGKLQGIGKSVLQILALALVLELFAIFMRKTFFLKELKMFVDKP